MSSFAARRRRSYFWLAVFTALLVTGPALGPVWLAVGSLAAVAFVSVRAARALERRREPAGQATVLGADRSGRALRLEDSQLSAHGLILGATGAGKSTTLLAILCDHIARGRPVVAIDMKGSPAFARQLAAAAAAAVRPFRLWTPDGPDLWNPLAHGNPTQLKDKLIATERFTEPHYQRAAERYVQTALQVLSLVHPGRPPTLDEVVDAMDPRRLAALLRHAPRERAERVQDYLAALTPDQLSAIRGLGTRLAIISESRSGEFLRERPTRLTEGPARPAAGAGPAQVDLRRALAGGEVVLFSLNSSTYGKLAAQLGTLAVQDLVTAVGGRLSASPGGQPAAIIGIDEFSALGADNVVSLLARGREAGASVLLATQELADLDRAAPGLRDQVLGNTAIKIAHRQDVPASAQTISQMAGTERRWEETEQIGGGLLSGYPAGRGTRRQVEQFVVHPNEIKSLRTGEAIVIVKQPRAAVHSIHVSPPPAVRSRPVPARPPRPVRPDRGPELG